MLKTNYISNQILKFQSIKDMNLIKFRLCYEIQGK